MTTTIETKYGTANIGPDGYYRITSYKEGNHSKKLHRLIFEDFYQIKLPSNMVIHHEDENKLNNEMWNLVPMTHEEHAIIHHKGKPLSDEHKEKISQANKGKLISEESRKRMSEAHIGISPSVETRKKLSEAITGEKNYWYGKHHSDETKEKIRQSKLGTKHSEETKRKMSKIHSGQTHTLESRLEMSKNKTKTGIFNVFKLPNKSCKQGFTWAYYYDDENGKRKILSSVDLNKLKEKVLKKGLDWFELVDGEWVQCK